MPRLVRPHQPLSLKLTVARLQLGDQPDEVAEFVAVHAEHRNLGDALWEALEKIAERVGDGCTVADLHLDHDPALATRKKIYRCGLHVGYEPDANDPEHLRFRPHGSQFEGSHHIKTNVRGDGAQHPDRVLIKKNKRLEETESVDRETKSENRVTRGFTSLIDKSKPKMKSRGFRQMKCVIGARCFCVRKPLRDVRRCGNYRTQEMRR